MTTIKKKLDELSISDERLAELAAMPDDDIDTSDIPELGDEERRHYYVEDLPDDIVEELDKGFQGEPTPELDHLMDDHESPPAPTHTRNTPT